MTAQAPVRNPSNSREYESLAGVWKLLAALAVLLGHNLVTMTALSPESRSLAFGFSSLQIFSPLHFFFFSGYLAAPSLSDRTRPIAGTLISRALRIYILVVAALVLGVAARAGFHAWCGSPAADAIWPLSTWAGEMRIGQILLHLSPLGIVDTTQFDYATWYIYHELRLVALFPVFLWILTRKSPATKWLLVAATIAVAAVLENRFWSFFPLFRTSPFQTLSFGAFFLGGALVQQSFLPGGLMTRLGKGSLAALLVVGAGFAVLEPLGIRPHVKNPPILIVQTLLGQIAVFAALRALLGNFRLGPFVRKACDWSVGIYIVHPPIHMYCAWLAVKSSSAIPLVAGMVLSIFAGIAFHRFVELPSLSLTRRIRSAGSSR